jgi:hypothetical protein
MHTKGKEGRVTKGKTGLKVSGSDSPSKERDSAGRERRPDHWHTATCVPRHELNVQCQTRDAKSDRGIREGSVMGSKECVQ